MYQNFLPKFKVVEANELVGLRNGHIAAQTPAYINGTSAIASTTVGSVKVVENGIILGIGKDGVYENFDASKHSVPFLHWTEERVGGPLAGLDQFALLAEDDKAVYPRGIALYARDSFTTDNFSGNISSGTKFYAIVVNGILTLDSEGPFVAYKTTLPNGKAALQFTYVGYSITNGVSDACASKTWVNTQLVDYVETTTLADYATKTYVGAALEDYTDTAALALLLTGKQDKLTAGTGIEINVDNVISVTG